MKKKFEKLTKFELSWVIGLFGTAVGAGIQFLPIRAGMGGIIPVLIMVILAIPMTFLSHRGLARFVLSSKNGGDITDVVEESFGSVSGNIITFLYFFAIYPLVLAYGVGITNTVESFLVNQLAITAVPRWFVATALTTLMMSVLLGNKTFMLKVISALTYPLIATLFIFSLSLIPQWKADAFAISEMPKLKDILFILWATIPVLVFAFNHSPAISTFSLHVRDNYGAALAEQKASRILFATTLTITGFTMFFVISNVLTLTPDQFAEAREQNISILSYHANINKDFPLLAYATPLIAFLAIFSSFFGHYLGAKEGLVGLITKQAKLLNKSLNMKKVSFYSAAFIYITTILVSIANPSILGFMEDLGGPIIAAILFLMPIYAIYKVPAMAKYRNDKVANMFVLIIGLIAISGVLYKLVAGIFN